MDTPYANILISAAKQLVEKIEASSNISHNATKGALREVYLKVFLKDLVPHVCHMSSGFITDASGKLTPQIDLIGFDDALPSIALDDHISMVPIEAAKFWIEVKSILQASHLENIRERLTSIESMNWSILRGSKPAQFQPGMMPSGVIVAYECEVADETLKRWLVENRNLVSIIIIGKSYFWNLTSEPQHTEHIQSDGRYSEALFLAAKLHQLFVLMSRALENTHQAIASLPTNPTKEQVDAALKSNSKLDMVHYGLQTYVEDVFK